MYAVFSSGGKQYRVEAGSTLTVERLSLAPGSTVIFDRVLLVGDGEQVAVGAPTVAGAAVHATVLGEERGPKLVVFKFKPKVKYRRKAGHRQQLTLVRIDAISADGKPVKARAVRTVRAARAQAAAQESTAAEEAGEGSGPAPAAGGRRPRSRSGSPGKTAPRQPKPRAEE